jgi:hypothetical protein
MFSPAAGMGLGMSYAEVVPEAAGSQTPSVPILKSSILMENHEKHA